MATIVKKTIRLSGVDKPYDKVEAEIVGYFGIHRRADFEGTAWAITHVPTGFLVWTCRLKRTARRFVDELGGSPGWESKSAKKIQESKELLLLAKKARDEVWMDDFRVSKC